MAPIPATKAAAPVKAPVDADIRVCLDFLKGRCTRPRCRFHHPEMAGYQQLSGAVQAQAGKQICEVWAMAGQCKFGSKCNKLHPVVIAPPTTLVTSGTAVLPHKAPKLSPPAPAPTVMVPQRRPPAGTPLPQAVPPPGPVPPMTLNPSALPAPIHPHLLSATANAPATASANPRPLSARVASPPVPQVDPDFQDLAQSILKALEDERFEPTPAAAPAKGLTPAAASLFRMDRILLDILGDLNCTAC
eukprot:EG_transcript_15341